MGGASDGARVAGDYYAAFNRRDLAAMEALLADDAVLEVPGTGERHEGRDAVMASERGWLTAFPDGRIDIEEISGGGDTVVVEFTGRGTHTGPLQTPEGEIPATGRRGTLRFCDVMTVRDGRIRSVREYFDSLAMLTQLGLTAEPVAR